MLWYIGYLKHFHENVLLKQWRNLISVNFKWPCSHFFLTPCTLARICLKLFHSNILMNNMIISMFIILSSWFIIYNVNSCNRFSNAEENPQRKFPLGLNWGHLVSCVIYDAELCMLFCLYMKANNAQNLKNYKGITKLTTFHHITWIKPLWNGDRAFIRNPWERRKAQETSGGHKIEAGLGSYQPITGRADFSILPDQSEASGRSQQPIRCHVHPSSYIYGSTACQTSVTQKIPQ